MRVTPTTKTPTLHHTIPGLLPDLTEMNPVLPKGVRCGKGPPEPSAQQNPCIAEQRTMSLERQRPCTGPHLLLTPFIVTDEIQKVVGIAFTL